jgi:prevent-host-death family protein
MTWKLADAKNKFSEVFNKALAGEPQTISRRGEEVVVIARKDLDKIARRKKHKKNFIEFLLSAPSFEGVDLTRENWRDRDVKF